MNAGWEFLFCLAEREVRFEPLAYVIQDIVSLSDFVSGRGGEQEIPSGVPAAKRQLGLIIG